MVNTSFYVDGGVYDTAIPSPNDVSASTTPTQAPSSFYPDGEVYNALTDENAVVAEMTAIENATQAAQAAAGVSATNAAASAAASNTSAVQAAASDTNAIAQATTATTQAGIATTQASNAATSAAAALASQNASLASQNSATASASAASTSATNAHTSETNAAASASAAQASQTAAATSATNASASATSASSSASTATTQAGIATTQAGNASTSATNAGNSATAAASSASTATSQATAASGSASTATSQASAASTSATNAANSATSASGSASTATSQASAASSSATNASNSASSAATSASNAASAVQLVAGTASPQMNGTATVGTSTKWAHEDHVHPSTAPTPAIGDNSTRIATTAWIAANVTGASPVRYDIVQTLTSAQQSQARANIGVPAVIRNYIAGLTLTYQAPSTFGVAPGVAVDSTNSDSMSLGTLTTKTTSSWTVGSGVGGLDTGSISANTWYHVHLIKRPDTGVVDALCSLSATAPTLPSNYTLSRRLGSVKTNSSSQWIPFTQNGDEFLWSAPIADVSNYALTSTVASLTLSVPTNVKVNALIGADYTWSGGSQGIALLFALDTGTQAAGSPAGNWTLTNAVSGVYCATQVNLRTSTNGQIGAVAASSNSSGNSLYIITIGWIDRRGRDV